MERKKLNKRIILHSLILIFLLFATFVLADEEEKKVEVKLLWKKEFPDGIRHVGSIGEYPGFEGKPDLAPPFPRTVISNKARVKSHFSH